MQQGLLLNPAETVVDLAAALEDAGPAPESPEAIFVAGVRRWIGGEASTLDEALGLKGAVGLETARSRHLRASRNRHLRAAHALCDGASPWGRSCGLADEIGRFLSIIWPRWRNWDNPRKGCAELHHHLFHAAKCGRLPESVSQLHEVCSTNPPLLIEVNARHNERAGGSSIPPAGN